MKALAASRPAVGGVQAQPVGRDEPLPVGVRGEQGRVAEGDRERLPPVGKEGQGDPEPLAEGDPNAGLKARTDQPQGRRPAPG